jgi:hypothetical protein
MIRRSADRNEEYSAEMGIQALTKEQDTAQHTDRPCFPLSPSKPFTTNESLNTHDTSGSFCS